MTFLCHMSGTCAWMQSGISPYCCCTWTLANRVWGIRWYTSGSHWWV